jgi:hypothetical protein
MSETFPLQRTNNDHFEQTTVYGLQQARAWNVALTTKGVLMYIPSSK